jgi:hypothetical protein
MELHMADVEAEKVLFRGSSLRLAAECEARKQRRKKRKFHARGQLLADWMTEHQLAEELGKSIETVRSWRKARKGPPFRALEKTFIYERSVVQNWLRDGMISSPRERRQHRTGAST